LSMSLTLRAVAVEEFQIGTCTVSIVPPSPGCPRC
jgi:hypothetical protein